MASTKNRIEVGCCGFGMSQARYMASFPIVEVQQTFYEPAKTSTYIKWREQAPQDFVFAIKAWQLITHPSSSPTYRRLKRTLTTKELKESGEFRLTAIVKEAVATTLACADALNAKAILFQCPASFEPSELHLDNMRQFFAAIDRPPGVRFFWEPRGDWDKKLIRPLCRELDIFHAVDPFLHATETPKFPYFRLHGKKGWKSIYTDDELVQLRALLEGKTKGYVFFNNISMVDDAERFLELLQ